MLSWKAQAEILEAGMPEMAEPLDERATEVDFLARLGSTMLGADYPVTAVRSALTRISDQYGISCPLLVTELRPGRRWRSNQDCAPRPAIALQPDVPIGRARPASRAGANHGCAGMGRAGSHSCAPSTLPHLGRGDRVRAAKRGIRADSATDAGRTDRRDRLRAAGRPYRAGYQWQSQDSSTAAGAECLSGYLCCVQPWPSPTYGARRPSRPDPTADAFSARRGHHVGGDRGFHG